MRLVISGACAKRDHPLPSRDGPARRALAAGRVPDDDLVIFEAPRAWLEHLVELIAAETCHTRSKKRRALFDAVLDRIEGVV